MPHPVDVDEFSSGLLCAGWTQTIARSKGDAMRAVATITVSNCSHVSRMRYFVSSSLVNSCFSLYFLLSCVCGEIKLSVTLVRASAPSLNAS